MAEEDGGGAARKVMESFCFYQNCLFCPKDLSDDKNRFREHIIPENIFGFWKSKDICQECGKHFGDDIDDLTLKHPLIIEALKELNLSNKQIDDRLLNYYGIDKSSGKKITMVKKRDGFHVKTENDLIDEKALPWYFKQLYDNSQINQNIVEKEIDKIVNDQLRAKTGEITESNLFNSAYRKGTVHGVYTNDNIDITPLVAKIAVFTIFNIIDPKQIINIKNVDGLINRAFLKEEPQLKIIRVMGPREKCFKPYHYTLIDIYNNNNSIFINVGLFYYLWWVVILEITKPIVIHHDNKLLKKVGFKFDFSDIANPHIIPGLKYDD